MTRSWLIWILLIVFVIRDDAQNSSFSSLLDFPVHLSSGNRSEGQELLTIPVSERAQDDEWLLLVAHRWVKERWKLSLGGKQVGFLDQIEQPTWSVFSVEPSSLNREGISVTVDGPSKLDSIDLEKMRFFRGSKNEFLEQSTLEIEIKDEFEQSLPARVTVLDQNGYLVPLALMQSSGRCALRTGVAYVAGGSITLGMAAGDYSVFVTRGPEYERGEFSLSLALGESEKIEARLIRSVDTAGWISSDPHTHTFTNSRHGDATIEERVITFAGEALELPVATDHNILTDYDPVARKLNLREFFTPVIGDEVTTKEAHFNVFPLRNDSRLPNFRILDWPSLLENFRQDSTVRIAILNHPHNVHNGFRPFDRQHLNPVSGRVLKKLDLSVDAMEVLSSSAQQTDMMLVVRDWFALLNQGYRVVGLGSSDVHDVNRYIIGQGRTYIECDDSDVGRLNVEAACAALKQGRALISMGLFVNMTVNGDGGVGDLVTATDQLVVDVTVQAPSWMEIHKVELFANGESIREKAIAPADIQNGKGGKKVILSWDLDGIAHDTYLVAMATGPGDLGPSWPIPYPYQPTGGSFVPRVAGATNPIWIDRNGDGQFDSARAIGEKVWAANGTVAKVAPQLVEYDSAVVAQIADLAFQEGQLLWREIPKASFDRITQSAREKIQAFRQSVKER
jgi:hypothetical protein